MKNCPPVKNQLWHSMLIPGMLEQFTEANDLLDSVKKTYFRLENISRAPGLAASYRNSLHSLMGNTGNLVLTNIIDMGRITKAYLDEKQSVKLFNSSPKEPNEIIKSKKFKPEGK